MGCDISTLRPEPAEIPSELLRALDGQVKILKIIVERRRKTDNGLISREIYDIAPIITFETYDYNIARIGTTNTIEITIMNASSWRALSFQETTIGAYPDSEIFAKLGYV
jgi:hypothetical protein